jgi:PAS domain S-box-containing protein
MHDNQEKVSPLADDELLRLIFESATDFAIFTVDDAGAVTSWNPGAERMLGYTPDDIMGTSGDVIFTPEDRANAVPEGERSAARSKGRAEDERWHQRKDGSRFWGSGLMMPLKDNIGFVKILRDRTEQHQAQERLRENEERFRLLATSIPQLVFRSRSSGQRTWGSPQWEMFTGLSDSQSRGLGWLDGIHPDDREPTLAAWRDAQTSGEYYIEHRVRRVHDGEYRWHQTRARPIEVDLQPTTDWVGTSADIHDLRGLKDLQQVLMAELQHRTRNLLALVQSIARQTLKSSASLDAFGAEFGDRLRAVSRVQRLLEQTDHKDIDLHALVNAELSAHGDGKADKVIVRGDPIAVPAGSAQTLALALHELATNAVKYGALGQQAGRLAITWAMRSEGGERRLVLDWHESNVALPNGAQPDRKGFGTELIEKALPYQLKAETELRFGADGVWCTISVPLPTESNGE